MRVLNFSPKPKLDINLDKILDKFAETIFKETKKEYIVRIAREPEEIKALLEVRFEFDSKKDDLIYFQKRK